MNNKGKLIIGGIIIYTIGWIKGVKTTFKVLRSVLGDEVRIVKTNCEEYETKE